MFKNFFRRSFTAQVSGFLLLIALVLVGGLLFLKSELAIQYGWSMTSLDIQYVLYGASVLFLLLIFFFWYRVSKPLKEIIVQMEALITGREYKKFFTDRIDEVGVVAHFFNEITRNLHTFTSKIQEGDRMATELDVAANLQRDILPPSAPVVPGLIISAKTRPAAEVGGDSFDFLTVKDATYMYIGDATGHGVPAGIIMTIVHTLIYVYAEISSTLLDLMVSVNRHLKKRIKKTLFMSMLMLKWDHLKKVMSFVGAGHEYVLIYHMKNGQCEAIVSGGIALGMVEDNSKILKEIVLPFEENDMIILYTDGIVECRNVAGELYGLDRLKVAVAKYASQYSPDQTVQKIAAEVGSFMHGHIQDDDMTLMVIQNVGDKKVSPSSLSLKTDWVDEETAPVTPAA